MLQNRIVRQFDKSFKLLENKREKGWDKIYVGVDIHETTMIPHGNQNQAVSFIILR